MYIIANTVALLELKNADEIREINSNKASRVALLIRQSYYRDRSTAHCENQ